MMTNWRCIICGSMAYYMFKGSTYCQTHLKMASRKNSKKSEDK